MRRFDGKKLALMGVLTLTGLGTALASPPDDGRGPPREELILQADRSKDGKLDDSERQALRESMHQQHEAHRQQMLQKYDANRNGQLDPEERQKLHQERSAEKFKELDKDGNGSLSLAEFQAGMGKHAKLHGRRGR